MSMDEQAQGIGVRVDGAVLRLRIERPDRRNALTRKMLADLIARIENAPDDPALRVIVLSGEGENFCAGMDLMRVNAESESKPRAGDIQRRLPRGANRLIQAMLGVQLPIVCAVRGWASGLGCRDFHQPTPSLDYSSLTRKRRKSLGVPSLARQAWMRGELGKKARTHFSGTTCAESSVAHE